MTQAPFLKTNRLAKGFTQSTLAQAAGLTERTVQNVEGGREASVETLNALCAVLEVPLSDLTKPDPVSEADGIPSTALVRNLPGGAERLVRRLGQCHALGCLVVAASSYISPFGSLSVLLLLLFRSLAACDLRRRGFTDRERAVLNGGAGVFCSSAGLILANGLFLDALTMSSRIASGYREPFPLPDASAPIWQNVADHPVLFAGLVSSGCALVCLSSLAMIGVVAFDARSGILSWLLERRSEARSHLRRPLRTASRTAASFYSWLSCRT